MKTYIDILNEVKDKNPAINYRDAQITASKIFKQQKEAADKLKKETAVSTMTKPVEIESQNKNISSITLSNSVDAAIQQLGGKNRHNILATARTFDKTFSMITVRKEGVNTLVYLDGPCRVPGSGYYKIFI